MASVVASSKSSVISRQQRRSVKVMASLRFPTFSRFPSTPSPPARSNTAKLDAQRLYATGSAGLASKNSVDLAASPRIKYHGMHHVALLCENLERSLDFYQNLLGLEINPDRPHHKLPYRGAWLWIGPEMIHLMELPNPDPLTNRPEHGGRDRHFCVGVEDIKPLVSRLDAGGVKYTMSMSGRPAVFFRDPDMNCLEVVELESWR